MTFVLVLVFSFAIGLYCYYDHPEDRITAKAYRFFKRKKDWEDIADHVRLEDQMKKADKALYAVDPEFAIELGYVPPELERVKCKDCGQEEYKKDMDYYNPIPHDYKGYYKDSDELLCRPCLEKRKNKNRGRVYKVDVSDMSSKDAIKYVEKVRSAREAKKETSICIECGDEVQPDSPCWTCYNKNSWKIEQMFRKKMEEEHYKYHKATVDKIAKQYQFTHNNWWPRGIM